MNRLAEAALAVALLGIIAACGPADRAPDVAAATDTAADSAPPTSADVAPPGVEPSEARPPIPLADGAPVEGLDISHFQGDVEWDAVADTGRFAFVYLKATEGIDASDATFADHWRDAARVGLLRGAYHFYEPPDDPLEQARFFLDTVGPLGPGDLPPVLDVEVRRGVDAATILAGVETWLQAVEEATGRRAMVYTGVNFWNAVDAPGADRGTIAARPLWVASYRPQPVLPEAWTDWTFWQYTERATVPGIEKEVDLNRFNGALADLERLADLPPD